MLLIGVTYNPGLELFYSGLNQTALLLAELFKKLGHTVSLVDSKNTDTELFTPKLDGVLTTKLYQTKGLDYLIDIDGFVNPVARKSAAKNSIVFLRTFVQFTEMDNSVYPEKPYMPRSFEGVSEIWCWDILNPKETLDSIQTLFPCPIRTVPFIWSPLTVSQYNSGPLKFNTENPWTIHIAEKNTNNSSSSIIPLVAIRELVNNNKDFSASYKCHNMEHILENKFLNENVLNNIETDKLSIKFVAKEQFYSWLSEENSIMLSHSRFTPLRIGLINALWLGIPIIHNSPILKELHPVLEKMFYFGNSISGISECFSCFMKSVDTFIGAKESIQNAIIAKWSIENNLKAWQSVCSRFSLSPLIVDTAPIRTITIAFSDMWPGFNYNSNFIIDSLRHESKTIGLEIKGINYIIGTNPDLLIFGPYSNLWKTVPNTIPKVYFSGENWAQPDDSVAALYMTSSRREDDTHIRIPTWMMYIDWYSNATTLPKNCEDNPIRIPIHFAMTPHPDGFNTRKEFCGFVVSNPICSLRNDTFNTINGYKKVNSGGALYNNIGGQLSLKYPGGGCGDISKYNFFSEHKFAISFENSQSTGYITEKILHSKMAGCVPLYWGDTDTNTDFVNGSIVNLSMFNNPEQILEIIKKLEVNPGLCAKIASTPILNEEKKMDALKQLSKMSEKLLSIACAKKVHFERNLNLKNIDKVFIVNLDSRKDRWDTLCKEEPFITSIAERVSAVNGRTLKLTPYIYSLFKNNNFNWKKSVMGCSLSHLNIWTKILSQKSGNLFLILEDDVRFETQFSIWNKYAETIPEDAELIYIGGVLPPNKAALNSVIEPINDFWSKIKPNCLFTAGTGAGAGAGAEIPLFHFCTYSYIISRKAVEKLIQYLINSVDKKMTSAVDHFLGYHSLTLNTYVANPLITKCFQDDDISYNNAQFNNTGSIAAFDSDISNNTECFNQEELDVFRQPDKTVTLYHLSDSVNEIYEHSWITDVFSEYTLKKLENINDFIEDGAWFVIQRPYINIFNSYFKNLPQSVTFKVLHLSDEFGKDNIDFYNLPNCKGIIRNYLRSDIPSLSHIITIPLGYHHKGKNIKTFFDRKLVWSFHGNSWFDRKSNLENIYGFSPHNCFFVDEWNAPNMTKQDQYLSTLTNSKFCPILRGNNIETFRLYEVLEVGCIPVYVRQEGDDAYWQLLSSNLELLSIDTWDKAKNIIQHFLDNPEEAETYRVKLYMNWIRWKSNTKSLCKNMI